MKHHHKESAILTKLQQKSEVKLIFWTIHKKLKETFNFSEISIVCRKNINK